MLGNATSSGKEVLIPYRNIKNDNFFKSLPEIDWGISYFFSLLAIKNPKVRSMLLPVESSICMIWAIKGLTL